MPKRSGEVTLGKTHAVYGTKLQSIFCAATFMLLSGGSPGAPADLFSCSQLFNPFEDVNPLAQHQGTQSEGEVSPWGGVKCLREELRTLDRLVAYTYTYHHSLKALLRRMEQDPSGVGVTGYLELEKRVRAAQRQAPELWQSPESLALASLFDARSPQHFIEFRLPSSTHAFQGLYLQELAWLSQKYTHALQEIYFKGSNEAAALKDKVSSLYRDGESHARRLVHLGWIWHEDLKMLAPPESLADVFLGYSKQIAALRERSAIDESDLIRPALVFERRFIAATQGEGKSIKDFNVPRLYIRPGLDPWPDREMWQLTFGPRPNQPHEYMAAIAEGKIPLYPSPLLFQEFGRLTEFLDYPELMRELRWLAKQVTTESVPTADQRGRPQGEARFFILSDFFALPNGLHRGDIRIAFPYVFSAEGPQTLSEVTAYLKSFPESVLLRHAKCIATWGKNWILPIGGALRNVFREDGFESEVTRAAFALWSLRHNVPSLPPHSESPHAQTAYLENQVFAYHESLYGLWQEIALLASWGQTFAHEWSRLELAFEQGHSVPTSLTPELTQFNLAKNRVFLGKLGKKQRQERIHKLLADRIARFALALCHGLKHGITVEKVLADGLAQQRAVGSDTYSYLSIFAHPASLTYQAFQLDSAP